MTSVLIVEDQRMPRENMEHLVEDSGRYRRVASLSTAEMALAQCARHAVDLVLMDVCTKGSRDGIDVAAEIKARYPETKVIIITSMVEESYLKRAKAAGAESFWYKDVSPESLLEVMDRTMAGESLYPDRTPETRLGQVSSTQLTPREIEVLRLVCEGLEYEEIAAELGISSRTVKRFVSSLLEKIGYSNRTRLAIAVTKKKLHPPPSGGVRFCRAKPLSHGLRKDGRVVQRRSLPVRQTPLQRGAFLCAFCSQKCQIVEHAGNTGKTLGRTPKNFHSFVPYGPCGAAGRCGIPDTVKRSASMWRDTARKGGRGHEMCRSRYAQQALWRCDIGFPAAL